MIYALFNRLLEFPHVIMARLASHQIVKFMECITREGFKLHKSSTACLTNICGENTEKKLKNNWKVDNLKTNSMLKSPSVAKEMGENTLPFIKSLTLHSMPTLTDCLLYQPRKNRRPNSSASRLFRRIRTSTAFQKCALTCESKIQCTPTYSQRYTFYFMSFCGNFFYWTAILVCRSLH